MNMIPAVQEIMGQGIRFVQILFFPLFGFIILIGFFFYLFASKNPYRRRKAYLFSIFGAFGALLTLYLPLIISYFSSKNKPHEATGEESVRGLVDLTIPWGEQVYNLLKVLFEPFIFFGGYLGIAIWLLAAKNPPRKRIGFGMVIGAPLLWTLLQYIPDIYYFFIPANPQ
ncbi:hypothetical protein [Metabacillus fastidiosus]|uniref:hypothetical protein n=1 Tax=Metabacillus fastidiosus TaxID=1458 RepID=UPI003D2C2039